MRAGARARPSPQRRNLAAELPRKPPRHQARGVKGALGMGAQGSVCRSGCPSRLNGGAHAQVPQLLLAPMQTLRGACWILRGMAPGYPGRVG
eukprot:CAMPEP_0204594884 /NCGR_PEP_ID=MMETSP0661-20131031/52340_1 /ASSEMBLY_ACC=CAM_ASM_000606 /TAXON_ID=109239 /ORGANISM="Alexandrium margalefi, Strain AMGDE01CS-322" /LENGTH=91 /DNA_ID=CAMNT_0051605333 /DNA_START=52 /DNA_END=324 /DNA_ORIENTATION=-